MDEFVSLPDIVRIWGRGETKSSVRMKKGYDIDLRIVMEILLVQHFNILQDQKSIMLH